MKILILTIIAFLLTGCYNYNELNELDIVSSIIIDFKDDKYLLNFEILNTEKDSPTTSRFISSMGDNLTECFNNIYKKNANKIYLNHMETLLIKEDVAKNKLKETLDYLTRNPEIKKDFYLLVIDSEIKDIKKLKLPQKNSLGSYVNNSIIKNIKENGNYKTSTFREIINANLNKKNYFIGGLSIEEDNINLINTYLFSNNKLIQKVDKKAIILENILNREDINFLVGDKNIFKVYNYKLKKKISKNKLLIQINMECRIQDLDNIDVRTYKNIKDVENILKKEIKNIFNASINYSKNIDFDIYNFTYYYNLFYPQNKDDDVWKDISVEFIINPKINEKGLITERIE